MASKETTASPTAITAPPHILTLLARLHQKSLDQEQALKSKPAMSAIKASTDENSREQQRAVLMRDKFIALEPDKAAFMYSLVRAMGATNVVECGTSYGVSTIYLALAVVQNAKVNGKGRGRVVATEHEAEKATQARQYWAECGKDIEEVIELREGDLRETLKGGLELDGEGIDFVLMDSTFKSLEMPHLTLRLFVKTLLTL